MRVEGYFAKIKDANAAVEKLKSAGLTKAFVDINDDNNKERNVMTNLAGTETSVSLSGLVLESDSHSSAGDKSALTAASPMVSGLGNFEEVADINCKVIVDLQDSDANKARQMLSDMGGSLESPHIKKPPVRNEEDMI